MHLLNLTFKPYPFFYLCCSVKYLYFFVKCHKYQLMYRHNSNTVRDLLHFLCATTRKHYKIREGMPCSLRSALLCVTSTWALPYVGSKKTHLTIKLDVKIIPNVICCLLKNMR